MILNLFSSFDSSSSYLCSNWLSLFLPSFFMFSLRSFFNNSTPKNTIGHILTLLKNNLMTLEKNKGMYIDMAYFIAWGSFLCVNNMTCLLPYIYSVTTQFNFVVVTGLFAWLLAISYALLNSPKNFLSHLVPLNTPFLLIHFMVIIELISSIIRPLTLTIRLMANIAAGHLIMALLANQIPQLYPSSLLVSTILVLFLVMELAVAGIQAYVHCTLSFLYTVEYTD